MSRAADNHTPFANTIYFACWIQQLSKHDSIVHNDVIYNQTIIVAAQVDRNENSLNKEMEGQAEEF